MFFGNSGGFRRIARKRVNAVHFGNVSNLKRKRQRDFGHLVMLIIGIDYDNASLTGCFVHDFKFVAGLVDIHLVASHVFPVAYGARLTLVGTDGQLELGVLISIRMLLLVLLMQ